MAAVVLRLRRIRLAPPRVAATPIHALSAAELAAVEGERRAAEQRERRRAVGGAEQPSIEGRAARAGAAAPRGSASTATPRAPRRDEKAFIAMEAALRHAAAARPMSSSAARRSPRPRSSR